MTEDDGDEPLVLHGKVKKVKDRSTDAPTVTIEVPTFMGNGDPGLLMLPEVGMTYHAVVLERTGATTLTAAARARINILCAGNPHTWGVRHNGSHLTESASDGAEDVLLHSRRSAADCGGR